MRLHEEGLSRRGEIRTIKQAVLNLKAAIASDMFQNLSNDEQEKHIAELSELEQVVREYFEDAYAKVFVLPLWLYVS
jgi:hypothetical protein